MRGQIKAESRLSLLLALVYCRVFDFQYALSIAYNKVRINQDFYPNRQDYLILTSKEPLIERRAFRNSIRTVWPN